jgi:hypothetical protein
MRIGGRWWRSFWAIRKFEANLFGTAHNGHKTPCALRILDLCSSLILQAAEFGGFLFAAADQARFLKLQIAELLFVREVSVKLDEAAADIRVVLVLELIGKFDAASSIDGHFETGDTA